MTDRDVRTIRDLIHCQYATIIAKSAFAASEGESRLKLRGDKKLLDFHPVASQLSGCGFPHGDGLSRPVHVRGEITSFVGVIVVVGIS